MSSSPSQAAPTPDLAAHRLAALRAELDRLDDALHDTLMRRAELVAQVGALGAKGAVPLRPGREAAIIRRLLARHHGGLAPSAIVRIWRELLAGTTAQQRPMSIVVCEPESGPFLLALAREHFGALTPVAMRPTEMQAIAEVASGAATAAVLPAPAEGEPAQAAWWTALMQLGSARVHVVARLPFWAPRPAGTPQGQALVVSAAAPDPSGADRSLLGLEITPESSHAGLAAELRASGLAPHTLVLRHDGETAALALAELPGFIDPADPRLAALPCLRRPPVVLGAYAIPIGEPS